MPTPRVCAVLSIPKHNILVAMIWNVNLFKLNVEIRAYDDPLYAEPQGDDEWLAGWYNIWRMIDHIMKWSNSFEHLWNDD